MSVECECDFNLQEMGNSDLCIMQHYYLQLIDANTSPPMMKKRYPSTIEASSFVRKLLSILDKYTSLSCFFGSGKPQRYDVVTNYHHPRSLNEASWGI